MTAAMKAREKLKLDTLRGLMAAFTNELVSMKRLPHEELVDGDVLTVIRREVKKRKEAKLAFLAGGRKEQAEKEDAEQGILEMYLPQMMSKDDIKKVAVARKKEFAITEKKDAGRLMGMIMKDLKDKANGDDVKEVVDSLFA
jgi:hypothetical protein